LSNPSSDSFRNPLKYGGQDYSFAPRYLRNRDPSSNDIKPKEQQGYYPLASLWSNSTNGNLWALAQIVNNLADWVLISNSIGALLKVNLQSGTTPIVPTAGAITFNGAIVAAGTNPVRTDGTGPNTMALEVQLSQAIGSTNATNVGLSAFKNTQFVVDANGFVSFVNIPFSKINIQVVSTPGTSTYTPSAGTQYCVVQVIGGGGGGGGADANFASGSGGGAGAYAVGVFTVAAASGLTITVGAGGAGVLNSNGLPGAASSFGGNLVAGGGAGGINGPSVVSWAITGGLGGISSGSARSYSVNGETGYPCYGAMVPTEATFTIFSSNNFSGAGGNSVLGAGGFANGSSVAFGIGAAGTQGGGGSGANTNTGDGASTGGNGGNGAVIITEYIFG